MTRSIVSSQAAAGVRGHRREVAEADARRAAADIDRVGIVEANCFNAARFYACEPATVISAVSHHVRSMTG